MFFSVEKSTQGIPCFHYRDGFAVWLTEIPVRKTNGFTYFFQSILQRSSRTQDILPSEISDALKCLFDGLELSKQLKFLVSKQSIEDCFLFFSYCIGLMCRFMAAMLLKNKHRWQSGTYKIRI